jgi:hypothetical protein
MPLETQPWFLGIELPLENSSSSHYRMEGLLQIPFYSSVPKGVTLSDIFLSEVFVTVINCSPKILNEKFLK